MSTPLTVTAPGNKVHLTVMNADDGLPTAFALMGTRAAEKVAIRITGGCKNMGPEDKTAMLGYFAAAFAGYRGVAWSGGTRQLTPAGELDPMVTDVPGVIAAGNEGCVALGTVPRTEFLTLQGDSRLVLDQWGALPNPTMSGILIVQKDPDGTLGWDGDLSVYVQLMENWKQYAGFAALGLVVWNGGDVTLDEIVLAAARGWPVFIVRGSQRIADAVLAAVERNGLVAYERRPGAVAIPNKSVIVPVEKGDPATLRAALLTHQFIAG
ncbi:MAG: hypothetical protein HY369_05125 [Candidatus Aenigmarchaeota archaeon]|nr:hypothetical protein [Candidatus Aenigmarchaeota archaeon]